MSLSIVIVNEESEIEELLDLFAPYFHDQSRNDAHVISILSRKYYQYGIVVKVEKEGNTVGYCAYYANDLINRIAFVSMLTVASHFQGKGIGKMLLKHVIEDCKKRGMNLIRLEVANDNYNAINFYTKMGFCVSGVLSEMTSEYTRSIS